MWGSIDCFWICMTYVFGFLVRYNYINVHAHNFLNAETNWSWAEVCLSCFRTCLIVYTNNLSNTVQQTPLFKVKKLGWRKLRKRKPKRKLQKLCVHDIFRNVFVHLVKFSHRGNIEKRETGVWEASQGRVFKYFLLIYKLAFSFHNPN